MKPSDSDVWVLIPSSPWINPQRPGQLMVHALIHDGLNWQTRETIDWTAFKGSSQALGSLSLPETQLILALPLTDAAHFRYETQMWVGLEDSPHRLCSAAHFSWHEEVLAELRGTVAHQTVCMADLPHKAVEATPLHRVTGAEFKTIATWALQSEQASPRQFVQLLSQLVLKPGTQRQRLRCLAAVFIMGLSIAIQTQQADQFHKRLNNTFKSLLSAADGQAEHTVPWSDWVQQVAKFGQNSRSNLTAIQFQWRLNDPIQTTTELARPRKRLPKGCLPIDPQHAHCVAETLQLSRFHR